MALSDLLLFSGPILGLTGMALAKLPALVDAIQGTPGLSDFERYMVNARRTGQDYSTGMRALSIRDSFREAPQRGQRCRPG